MKKMKTKTKTFALVEIAILLCSMFLVATLPVIAADQTPQEVSASTSVVTTASEDEFTLDIFGNANEDDTIDMRDTTYIKLVIFGKKPKTDLADANYDGKVSMLDVGQTKLIILGKEKKLTILDNCERSITLMMPLERVVLARMGCIEEALVAIGATDKVVGVSSGILKNKPHIAKAGGLMDLPDVGNVKDLDYEKIIELNPDVVYVCTYYLKGVVEKIPDTIPVVALELAVPDTKKVIPGFKTLGVMFGKEKKANEVIDWIQKYDSIVRDRTKDLALEEMPTFYIERADWVTYGSDKWDGKAAAECGGRNIIDGVELFIPGSWGEYVVDPEWVLEQNPDVIFRRVRARTHLVTEEKAKIWLAEVVDRPGWDGVSAVKNGRVYLYIAEMNFAPSNIIGRCYFAKFLQPDLFSDLNPREISDEYWKTFMGIEYPEMFVYPEPS